MLFQLCCCEKNTLTTRGERNLFQFAIPSYSPSLYNLQCQVTARHCGDIMVPGYSLSLWRHHSARLQPIIVEVSRCQDLQTASHSTSAVSSKERNRCMHACSLLVFAQLDFFTLIWLRSSHIGSGASTVGWVSPHQLTQLWQFSTVMSIGQPNVNCLLMRHSSQAILYYVTLTGLAITIHILGMSQRTFLTSRFTFILFYSSHSH